MNLPCRILGLRLSEELSILKYFFMASHFYILLSNRFISFSWCIFNHRYIIDVGKFYEEFPPNVSTLYTVEKGMLSYCHVECLSTLLCFAWHKPGQVGFIISYFNDYLARCVQHNFTSLSLQLGDMAVKLGLIPPKAEAEKKKARPVKR